VQFDSAIRRQRRNSQLQVGRAISQCLPLLTQVDDGAHLVLQRSPEQARAVGGPFTNTGGLSSEKHVDRPSLMAHVEPA